jgi:O-antigen ligase
MNAAAAGTLSPTSFAVSGITGRWLALLLTFCIPWGDMITIADLSFSRWLTLPLVLAWTAALWRSPVRKAQSSHVLMMAFIAWAMVGVLVTLDLDRSVRRVFSYCQLFLQTWMIYQYTRGRRDWHNILQAFLLGSWIPIIGVLNSWRVGYVLGDGRYTASGFDPNDLAATLALGLPIAWYQISRFNHWRWLNALFIPGAVASILLTASRGGLVVLAIGGLFPLWAMRKLPLKRKVGLVCVLVLIGGAVLNMRDEISFHRLATLGPQLAARDLNGRFEAWVRGFDVLIENPLTGVGPGSFSAAVASGGGTKVAAHNTFLEVAAEHGVIGFALFASVIGVMLVRAQKLASLERGLLTTLLCIWAVASSALSWENREITWLVWAFCACSQSSWFPVPARRWVAPHTMRESVMACSPRGLAIGTERSGDRKGHSDRVEGAN